jgi:hypothetical protein
MIVTVHELSIDIGGIPILVRTDSADFADMLVDRYGEFVSADAPHTEIELEIRLQEPGLGTRDSGLGTRDKGHGVRDTGIGNRESGVGVRDSDSGPRTPDPRLDYSGPESPISGVRWTPSESANRTRVPSPESLTPDPESRVPSPESRMSDPYDVDLSVRLESGRWIMERGDFRAEWDPETKRGWVRTSVNPYSIDGVLRILHSLVLAREGGLLVHGASAVRNGRAFVFAGVSGTGKTTISRLAPADVTLLTDEISYIRDSGHGTREKGSEVRSPRSEGGSSNSRFKIQDSDSLIADTQQSTANSGNQILSPGSRVPSPASHVPSPESLVPFPVSRVPDAFQAYGTPFAGELARIGVKTRAPLAGLFLLQQGPENHIEPVSEGQAVRELMRHILFFAHDPELVELVFQTVCDFVKRVPVKRLVFKKDASVWELIG